MQENKPRRNVFHRLLFAMIAFGLSIGMVFPPITKSILHTEKALSAQFMLLCLGAGLLVGLVNYLLFHLVISKELGRIIKGMLSIIKDIQNTLHHQVYSDNPCELDVTSNDLLGEVVTAFNSMGRAIDERQIRERKLREVMSTLSNSVDLTFIGQIILTHIPAPPAWQHALLYVLVDQNFRCIAMKNVNEKTVTKTLTNAELDFFRTGKPDHCQTMNVQESCFRSLEILQNDVFCKASHITIAPLAGDEGIIGFIATACHEFNPLTIDEQRCRTYRDHVQPYLRSALLHKRIEELATIDELSQILNRHAGMHRLLTVYSAAARHKFPLSVIMLDIDYFKKINDIYGHQAGDLIIRELSRRMQTNLRDEDILFRYGGEEFAIILPHIDQTGAALCAERIRFFIRDTPFNLVQDELQVKISLGVASWPQVEALEPDMLINLADKALYWAKENGRDQVAVQTDSRILSFTQYLNSLDTQKATA